MSEAENYPTFNDGDRCKTPLVTSKIDRQAKSLSKMRTIMKNREKAGVAFRPQTERQPGNRPAATPFGLLAKTVTFDDGSPEKESTKHTSATPGELRDEQSASELSIASSTSAWAMVGDGKLADKSIAASSPERSPQRDDTARRETMESLEPPTKALFSPMGRNALDGSPFGESMVTPESRVSSLDSSFPKAISNDGAMQTSGTLGLDESTLFIRQIGEGWERNKTLVKEIRFAEQTCMELSCVNDKLEEQNGKLGSEVEQLKQDLRQANANLQESRLREKTAALQAESLTSQMDTLRMQRDLQVEQAKIQISRIYQASRAQCQQMSSVLTAKTEEFSDQVLGVKEMVDSLIERFDPAKVPDCSFDPDASEIYPSSGELSTEVSSHPVPPAVGNVPGLTITTNDDIVSQFSEEFSESACESSSAGSSYGDGAFPKLRPSTYENFSAHMDFLVSPNAVLSNHGSNNNADTSPFSQELSIKHSVEEYEELELRYSESEDRNSLLEEELKHTKDDLNRAMDELIIAKQQHEENTEDLSAKHVALQQEAIRLKKEVNTLTDKLDTESKERRMVQIKLVSMQTETVTCRKKKSNILKKSLNTLRGKSGKSKSSSTKLSPYKVASPFKTSPYREVVNLRRRVDIVDGERTSLVRKAKELEQLTNKQNSLLENASTEKRDLQDKMTTKLGKLEQELQKSQSELTSLQMSMDTCILDKTALATRCKKYEQELETLQNTLDSVIKEKENLETDRRDGESEQTKLNERVTCLEGLLEKAKEEHKSELVELRRSLSTTGATSIPKNDSAKEAVVELKNRLAEARQVQQARDDIMGQIDSIAGRLVADSHQDNPDPQRAEFRGPELGITLKKLGAIEAELRTVRGQLRERDNTVDELCEDNETLTKKCQGLQRYVRKLTKKCDRWESFLDRESRVMHNLQVVNSQTMKQASEIAHKFKERDMLYTAEKAKRFNLEKTKEELEYELNQIAKELSSVSPKTLHC